MVIFLFFFVFSVFDRYELSMLIIIKSGMIKFVVEGSGIERSFNYNVKSGSNMGGFVNVRFLRLNEVGNE